MFASSLALLSGAAFASASGLISGSTSPYGQSTGNVTLQQGGVGYLIGGGEQADLTVSVNVTDGDGLGYLNLLCPHAGLQAVLVPTGDANPQKYVVEFADPSADRPHGTIVGGWYLSDDKTGLPDGDYVKIKNHIIDGNFLVVEEHEGVKNAFTFVEDVGQDHADAEWFLLLDQANDATCQ
ncbi:hypothetical protein HDZ31DRAFT_60947 [Schizophyllum fasciatum]